MCRYCNCCQAFNSMGKDEKCKPNKLIIVKFRVSMHCEGCETKVAKTLSKFEGVEKFTIDRDEHRVVVTGWFDPEKLLKKLKKTTKMTVEILCEEDMEESCNESDDESDDTYEPVLVPMQQFQPENGPSCMNLKSEASVMFSDENACVIIWVLLVIFGFYACLKM